MKKVMLSILVILWMGVIFALSSQNGTDSSKTSDTFSNKIIIVMEKITNKKYSDQKKVTIRIVIRKIAHFTEFLILGVLTYLMFTEYKVSKVVLISILLCFFYACSDEIHQLFIIERAPQIIDVIIDTCGSITGVFIFNKIYRKKHNNLLTNK